MQVQRRMQFVRWSNCRHQRRYKWSWSAQSNLERTYKSVKALEFPLVWRLEAAPKARKKATKRANNNKEGADEDHDNIVPISVKVVHSEGPGVKPAGRKKARIVTEEQTGEHEGVLISE